MNTHIKVHAMIPGRPLWKSLKSKYLPNLGLSSIPMKRSYIADPLSLLALMMLERSSNPLTTELAIRDMGRAGMSLDIRESGEKKAVYVDRY